MISLLVVEDQAVLRKGIVKVFKDCGYFVDDAEDGETAIEMFNDRIYDIVVTDLKLPNMSGMDVLLHAKSVNPVTEVLVMTAYGTVENAIEAMKLGAFDFLQKPFGIDELEMRVNKVVQQGKLLKKVDHGKSKSDTVFQFQDFIGVSDAIGEVLDTVRKVAPSKSNVLITGETGTGKELIAGLLHNNSPRVNNKFIKINCAALPENLLESELFGHEKGAFTGAIGQRTGRFEQANNGTILLDEIADMSSMIQAKILRVLQEREFEKVGGNRTIKVDVRIIAATNRDINEEREKGQFRDDLYYRLNVVSIHIPPLRERIEDILPLSEYFLSRYSKEMGKGKKEFSEQALDALMHHDWAGNVRELENTLERAVLLCESDFIDPEDLNLHAGPQESVGVITTPQSKLDLKNLEKKALLEALQKTDFVQKDAAKLLGISKRVIHYKIKQFGIKHPKWKKNK